MDGDARERARGDRPFYVGYLELPRGHRVFLMIAVPLVLIGLAVGAVGLSRAQPAWGDGFWQTGEASFWRGTLVLEPYPMLHVRGEESVETSLLVEMGKFGSRDRFGGAGVDGASVEIRGRELVRDGRRVIEIDPDSDVLGPSWRVVEDAAVRAPVVMGHERVELVGEIVDSKCFLGAMKPGAGRGHKACATLCIDGGIPPVLVVFPDGEGAAAEYWLLTDADGGALETDGGDPDVAGWRGVIGERVVLTGRAGFVGSWRVLALDGLSR